MAVETTTIQGKILSGDGVVVPHTHLTIRLSEPARVDDAGESQVVSGYAETESDDNGDVSFALIPNDVLTPAGTYYRVEYRTPDGLTWVEKWNLGSAPDPVDIGAIPEV